MNERRRPPRRGRGPRPYNPASAEQAGEDNPYREAPPVSDGISPPAPVESAARTTRTGDVVGAIEGEGANRAAARSAIGRSKVAVHRRPCSWSPPAKRRDGSIRRAMAASFADPRRAT